MHDDQTMDVIFVIMRWFWFDSTGYIIVIKIQRPGHTLMGMGKISRNGEYCLVVQQYAYDTMTYFTNEQNVDDEPLSKGLSNVGQKTHFQY